jgi:hypothetical protein
VIYNDFTLLRKTNFTLTGFFVDPYQSKESFTENSKKGEKRIKTTKGTITKEL